MSSPLVTVPLRVERDVVLARQCAREVAKRLGFDALWQTRVATAVSEIARNAFRYAGGGVVDFDVESGQQGTLVVRVRDAGPGIPNLDAVLSGNYVSSTGMGLGLVGTQRLMDVFRIETSAGGTEVVIGKRLPTFVAPDEARAQIVAGLRDQITSDPVAEIQHQNRELLAALDEIRRRQADLDRVNAELEDTNRGVMALYAELDEKALSLQRASESKTRFLSNMTHEFRTPLNSILSLSRLLMDRLDGDLSPEQERQVSFIRKSAEDLLALVNDLLDIAKVEAGRIEVRPSDFSVADLFGGLKGVLKPLLTDDRVRLVFDETPGLPPLFTDEAKVSQILRNFISNALKFTPAGDIVVRAEPGPADSVAFSVADRGIGIAPENHELIFEEFRQVDGPLQRTTKGTGLGLPLSRKLAELLGGSVWVVSALGEGSTFGLMIPAHYGGAAANPAPAAPPDLEAQTAGAGAAAGRSRVLLIDDEERSRYVLRTVLAGDDVAVREANSPEEGIAVARSERPDAIFLDLVMPGLSGEAVLDALDAFDETREIPVILFTSESLDGERRAALEARTAAIVSKSVSGQEGGTQRIRNLLADVLRSRRDTAREEPGRDGE